MRYNGRNINDNSKFNIIRADRCFHGSRAEYDALIRGRVEDHDPKFPQSEPLPRNSRYRFVVTRRRSVNDNKRITPSPASHAPQPESPFLPPLPRFRRPDATATQPVYDPSISGQRDPSLPSSSSGFHLRRRLRKFVGSQSVDDRRFSPTAMASRDGIYDEKNCRK